MNAACMAFMRKSYLADLKDFRISLGEQPMYATAAADEKPGRLLIATDEATSI
jgi:hypothetical protein